MRLATSVNLFFNSPTGGSISISECVLRCVNAGFKVLDMDFFPMFVGKYLAGDDWEKRAYAFRETSEKAGAVFSTAKLPFCVDSMRLNAWREMEYSDYLNEYARRAAIICGILGVKWAVCYPIAHYDRDMYNTNLDLSFNLELYKPVLEKLTTNGIGLTFKNISSMQNHVKRRYSAIAEELCELADAFQDKNVGVCWDFGSANRIYKDQSRALRMIGNRLKATVLNDNPSHTDSYALPFIGGNIKWETYLPILNEIGYDGDLSLEIRFAYGLPDVLKDKFAHLAFEAGSYCMKIANGGLL